jgi:hypothetical protein
MLLTKKYEIKRLALRKRTDWLHPSHGKFPDHAAQYEETNTGDLFTCAVWKIPSTNKYISAVEGPEHHHFGMLQTYLWREEPPVISCKHERKFLATFPIREKINSLILVAMHSIQLYAGGLGS